VGLRPQSFTPDGRILAYDDNTHTGTAVEIWTLPLDLSDIEHPKPGKPEPLLTTAARQVDAAYFAGWKVDRVFVERVRRRRCFRPAIHWVQRQMANFYGGGKFPTWSRTAHELFYFSLADNRIMVAR
jgi:hypothetical protein